MAKKTITKQQAELAAIEAQYTVDARRADDRLERMCNAADDEWRREIKRLQEQRDIARMRLE